VKVVKQHWFPIREIRGVKAVNLEAALYLDTSPDGLVRLGVNTTTVHRRAKVVLSEGEKALFEKTVGISPDAPYFEEIKFPERAAQDDLRLELFSSTGERVIGYTPAKPKGSPMPEPVEPPKDPEEIGTVDELYHAGLRLEQFHNPARDPYPYYQEALKRDPDHYAVNTALAILYHKRGMFIRAERCLNRALKRATENYTRPKDGEAYYYLGLALRAQHRYQEACDAFYRASWSQAWGAASFYQLAELTSREGDFPEALAFITRSLGWNAMSLRAKNLRAVLLRKMGRLEEAARSAEKILSEDPLNFWASNELCVLLEGMGHRGEAAARKERLDTQMRHAAQNYLELAVDYGNGGFWDEAIDVLGRLERKGSSFPMVHYYLGYYLDQCGDEDKAKTYFKKAGQMPPDYCFPFRWESRDVLEKALEKNPGDAKAFYYLGNLLFDHQPEEALKFWEKCVVLDDHFVLAHRNLGLAYARVQNDVTRGIKSMEKAWAHAPSEPRLYSELDQLYEAGSVSAEKRLAFLAENHAIVKNRDDALAREVELLVLLGDYERALEIFGNHHFHVWEGGGRIHGVYVDAHLLRGLKSYSEGDYDSALESFLLALEYPENLEVGKPVHGGGEPKVHYFIGAAYEALGEKAIAREYFESAVAQRRSRSELSFYQGMSYQKLGRIVESERIFLELMRFAQERLEATTEMDFFTKFGERQSAAIRRAQAHYLLGLSYAGRGDKVKARSEFKKALELNINHLWAKYFLGTH
jgi:tetratricopeptide (TPR) repeat protein